MNLELLKSDVILFNQQREQSPVESADLSYADLSYANLSYANLSCANLRGANLSYANLSYANLSDANLSDANLIIVIFQSSTLLDDRNYTLKIIQTSPAQIYVSSGCRMFNSIETAIDHWSSDKYKNKKRGAKYVKYIKLFTEGL